MTKGLKFPSHARADVVLNLVVQIPPVHDCACIIALDTRSAHDVSSSLLASWQKHKNGAADGDVRTRKAAMQSLSRDLQAVVQQFGGTPSLTQSAPSAGPHDSSGVFLEEVMAILMEALAKVMFKGLADPTEACR